VAENQSKINRNGEAGTAKGPPRKGSLALKAGVGAATGAAWWLMRARLRRIVLNRLALFPRVVGPRTPQDLNMAFEEVWFPSRDGLKLHGWYIPASPEGQPPKNITIISGHGHTGNKEPDLEYAAFFYRAGYNVFMFDFRGHGRSEGPRGASMGYWERLDVHGAVDWLLGRGQTRFAAFGISMGASILIMGAAENPYIRAVIADSPYAELSRSIAAEINNLYHIPSGLARLLSRYAWRILARHHHFPPRHTSPADYVAAIAPRPLFIIHGGADRLTRLENAYILYELAGWPKELWIQPEVAHAQSYVVYGQEYEQRVLKFLDTVDWEAPLELKAPEQTLEGFKVGPLK
jgi:uncharacterized protein